MGDLDREIDKVNLASRQSLLSVFRQFDKIIRRYITEIAKRPRTHQMDERSIYAPPRPVRMWGRSLRMVIAQLKNANGTHALIYQEKLEG